MLLTWYPDFCPPGGSCELEIAPDWSSATIRRFCPRHQAIKTALSLTDDQMFGVLLAGSRRKEAARWIIKSKLMELGLMTKEHPGVPYTVDVDGNFILASGTSGATRTQLRTLVSTALASLEAPAGTSTVTVT